MSMAAYGAYALACLAIMLGFSLMRRLSAWLGHPPWANPVLATALLILACLAALRIDVPGFQTLTAPLLWMLGPAIVALAAVADLVRPLLAGRARAALLAVIGGALFGMGCAWALAMMLGLKQPLAAALTVKTVSSPFLIAILGRFEGPVALAAALSVTTGVISAMLMPLLFRALGLADRDAADRDAQALALGVSGHLVGSEYAIRTDPARGGLAIIALVVTGLMAAVLLPLLWGTLLG